MNASDGQHIDEYDVDTSELLFAEAADLIRAFGFSAAHVVLIGGVVPGLLVPVLEPGLLPHIGTADIDFCLTVALIEGDTLETYERIETVLKRLGFRQGDTSFRWQRETGLKVTVEFFCPAGKDRPAGQMFRPKSADFPIGKHNLGSNLSALALDAGNLLTSDTETISRTVTLPDNKGTIEATLRVTGPLGFLAAKAQALLERDKPKDAYDIVWLIENWPGGPRDAAAAFAARAQYNNPTAQTALRQIADAFAAPDSIGSRSYARFLSRDAPEQARLERQAIGAIGAFTAALPKIERIA